MASSAEQHSSMMVECEVLGSLNMDVACCICFQLPEPDAAVCVAPCMHLFCRRCLHQALETRRECPVDRTPLTEPLAACLQSPSSETMASVLGIPVRCSMRAAGCTWEGSWGEWCQQQHGRCCPHAPQPRCPIPSCTADVNGSVGDGDICTPHEQSHAAHHIRLLARLLLESEAHRRRLEVELTQVKERLYTLQNDVTDVQHRQRRDNESVAATMEQHASSVALLLDGVRQHWPQFRVPGLSHAATSTVSTSREWDSLTCSRSAVLREKSVLQHGGAAVRGWASALAKHPITITNTSVSTTTVAFRVLPPLEPVSPHGGGGSSTTNFEPSMVMIGLAVSKSVAGTSGLTSHIGSTSGCVAIQGSGFVWGGDARQCCMLPTTGDDGTLHPMQLGTKVCVELAATATSVVITVQWDAADGVSVRGTVASLPWPPQRETLSLFPCASIGAACCDIELVA